MKLLYLFVCLAYGRDFQQRRRFNRFHTNRILESIQLNDEKSEMPGQQDVIDPKLQSLIDSMITDRQKISISDFTAWNLYRKNLNHL